MNPFNAGKIRKLVNQKDNDELKQYIKREIAKEIKPLQEKVAELYAENLRLKIALGGM